MSASTIHLLASEILIFADVGHTGEHVCESLAPGALECGLQNLSMFLLGATVASCCALFQCKDEFVRKISHHQLRHGQPPISMKSMLASRNR
jgi:hypothetical protein